ACAAWPASSMLSVTVITKTFDRSVGSWAFAPDSRTIYLTAEDRGHERLFAAHLDRSDVAMVDSVDAGVLTNLQMPKKAAAPILVATFGSAVSPSEVVRVDPNTRARTYLSSFNKEKAASIDWPALSEFTFT